ncbi:MAG TPA: LacI family DNA-binding transcriptional regulator [Thermomicrobiales bacterium]|jgi:LacI family transcriptional regulator
MAATIKDVAKRAGVSVITVSRVINGAEYVRAETQARVQAAINELHYVPNQLASSLRSRQNDTLALVVPDIATTFWTAMARGAEDEAWESGYSLFLCNTDDEPAKEERYIENLLRRRVAGLAVVATIGSTELLRRLETHHLPFVMMHRKIAGIEADVIRSDSRKGAFALTKRLLDAGWRRIAYVGGPLASSLGQDRLAGYRDALQSAGITPDPALIKLGEHTQQSGYTMMAELVRTRPLPEAICIGNSRLALGALHALTAAGTRVPEDLTVATFFELSSLIDDSRLVGTPLIVATQPAYQIGRLGIRRLLERIAGQHGAAEDILLAVDVVDRAGYATLPIS